MSWLAATGGRRPRAPYRSAREDPARGVVPCAAAARTLRRTCTLDDGRWSAPNGHPPGRTRPAASRRARTGRTRARQSPPRASRGSPNPLATRCRASRPLRRCRSSTKWPRRWSSAISKVDLGFQRLVVNSARKTGMALSATPAPRLSSSVPGAYSMTAHSGSATRRRPRFSSHTFGAAAWGPSRECHSRHRRGSAARCRRYSHRSPIPVTGCPAAAIEHQGFHVRSAVAIEARGVLHCPHR